MGGVAGERDDLSKSLYYSHVEGRSDRLEGLTLGNWTVSCKKARQPPVGNVNDGREPGTPHFNPVTVSLCEFRRPPLPDTLSMRRCGAGLFHGGNAEAPQRVWKAQDVYGLYAHCRADK